MEHEFELPVELNGEELLLSSRLFQFGFTHRVGVTYKEQEILFEPDEEGSYRAVIDYNELDTYVKPPGEVIIVIVEAIQHIMQ